MPSTAIVDAIRRDTNPIISNSNIPETLESKVYGYLLEFINEKNKIHGFITRVTERLQREGTVISQGKMSELLKTWNLTKPYFQRKQPRGSQDGSSLPTFRRDRSLLSNQLPLQAESELPNQDDQYLQMLNRNLLDLSFEEYDLLAPASNSVLWIKNSRNIIVLTRILFADLFSKLRMEVNTNCRERILKTLKKISLIPILIFADTKTNNARNMEENLNLMINDDWSKFDVQSLPIKNLSNAVPQRVASAESKAYNLLEKGYISKSYQRLIQKPLAEINVNNGSMETLRKLHPRQYSSEQLAGAVNEETSTQDFLERIERFIVDTSRSSTQPSIFTPYIDPSDVDLMNMDDSDSIVIKPAHILHSLSASTMKRNRAPGPSKLRKEHIKQLVGNNDSNEEKLYLRGLADFLTLIANNSLPKEFMNWLASANLVAISKEEMDPSSVRPIALGDTYRKMVASALLRANRDPILDFFGDIQMGVGTFYGAEKIIHAARARLSYFPEHDFVSLDSKNAFNSISRKVTLAAIKIHFPKLFPFLFAMYGEASKLWIQDSSRNLHVISSEEGAQQGDALGPLFFSVGVHALLREVNGVLSISGVNAYIDDFCLKGPSDEVLKALKIIRCHLSQFGLRLNGSKCKVLLGKCASLLQSEEKQSIYLHAIADISVDNILHNPGSYPDPLFADCIAQESKYGVVLLGAPIGTKAFILSFIHRAALEFEKEVNELQQKDLDPQALWTYLHYCIKPKTNFYYRTVPTIFIGELADTVDRVYQQFLFQLLKLPLQDQLSEDAILALDQSKWPIANGGLGLGYQIASANSAFLASVSNCMEFIGTQTPNLNLVVAEDHSRLFPDFMSCFKIAYIHWFQNSVVRVGPAEILKNPQECFEEWLLTAVKHNARLPKLQNKFMESYYYFHFEHLTNVLHQKDVRFRARIQSLLEGKNGKFLHAWPSKSWKMSADAFINAIRMRLGLPLLGITGEHYCNCASNALLDRCGDHLLSCALKGLVSERHDLLV